MPEPLSSLAELPSADPDPARAQRIRVRCRTRLAQQASRAPASARVGSGDGKVRIWQPAIVVLGVGYMTEVIIQALRVYGVL
jgi:hypothetical protein